MGLVGVMARVVGWEVVFGAIFVDGYARGFPVEVEVEMRYSVIGPMWSSSMVRRDGVLNGVQVILKAGSEVFEDVEGDGGEGVKG